MTNLKFLRNPTTWSGAPTAADLTAINNVTREGYTWQTALGAMGLNHMNGLVQDSISGRFISPDPNIPDPMNTGDYNRYSYVNSIPMTFTDPTGFAPCWDCGAQEAAFRLQGTYESNYDSLRRYSSLLYRGFFYPFFEDDRLWELSTPMAVGPTGVDPAAGGGGAGMPTGANPTANCTAPPMNTEALRNYSPGEPNYHEFTAYTAIGPDWLISDSFLDDVFKTWRYGEGLLAPGAQAGIADRTPALLGSPILFPD